MIRWKLAVLLGPALSGAACAAVPANEDREQGPVDLPLSDRSSEGPGDLAGHCANGRRDHGESDVDCGGPCSECSEGRACASAEDCRMGACIEGRCARNRVALRGRLVIPEAVYSIAIADVTNDGLPDVVFGNTRLRYGVLAQIKGGTFRLLGAIDIGTQWVLGGSEFCLGDVTGDGKVDLVGATLLSPHVVVAEGDGAGRFVARGAYRVTAGEMLTLNCSLACGDFDGDGDVDVAVGGPSEGLVLLRNQGKGALVSEVLIPLAAGVTLGPGADMDADGIQDLVAQNTIMSRRLSVRSSCARTTYSRVVVGDFDGDRRLDIGAAREICLGDGQGGLQPVRPVKGGGPREAWAGDVTGDRRTDLIMPDYGNDIGLKFLRIAPGRGDGNLVYTSSVKTDLFVSGETAGTAGRLLSETRDDVVVGVEDRSRTRLEVQILTIN